MKNSKRVKNSVIIISIILNIVLFNLYSNIKKENERQIKYNQYFLPHSIVNVTEVTNRVLDDLNKELFESKSIYSNEKEDRGFVMKKLEETEKILGPVISESSEWYMLNPNFSMNLNYLDYYLDKFEAYFKGHYGSVDKKHLDNFEEITKFDLYVDLSIYEEGRTLPKKPNKYTIETFQKFEDKCSQAIDEIKEDKKKTIE